MPTGQSVCGISSDASANSPLACKVVAGAGSAPGSKSWSARAVSRPGWRRIRDAGLGSPWPEGRILVLMKPTNAASRRFLPGSPFNARPADPPVEQFTVRDQVTHDKYGLGWVVLVEDDDAVIVGFGSRNVRILSPFGRLTKL
jgi:hypothetical protein